MTLSSEKLAGQMLVHELSSCQLEQYIVLNYRCCKMVEIMDLSLKQPTAVRGSAVNDAERLAFRC